MLAIIIALISIVAYFAYQRPEALAGKRAEIKVDIEPLIAPLQTEIENLKQKNVALKGELERLATLRSRVWAYLDVGSSQSMYDIVTKLGLTDDPTAKKEVEAS